MKDTFYNPEKSIYAEYNKLCITDRNVYNPRYDFLSAGILINFDF